MLLEAFGQLCGNALSGAQLLFDMRQFSAGFFEQQLADGKVDGRVDVNEKHSREEQNGRAVTLDQQRLVRNEEPALIEQKKADGHKQNRGCKEDIGNHERPLLKCLILSE